MSIASKGKNISVAQELKEVRHTLHRLAERAGSEERTAGYIEELLERSSPDELHTQIGGHGLVAKYKGREEGPVLMFRAELDALPIKEDSDLPYTSEDPDTSHRCGHDGHMTTLIGISRYLQDLRPDCGEVWLLFQPAEETGQGADRMLQDEFFDQHRPDLVFAYHNLPGYPKHQIIVSEGIFTATVRSLVLRFEGATSHAGQPEKGKNPSYAIARLIDACDEWTKRKATSYFNVVPIHIKVGTPAYGTSPGRGELHLTFRSTDPKIVESLKEEITAKARELAEEEKLTLDMEWVQPFESCINSKRAVEMIRRAANSLSLQVDGREEPYHWGEDFGKFTQAFEGALCCIGAGEDHAALHSPDYDFPDELLQTAIDVFREIIEQNLNDA